MENMNDGLVDNIKIHYKFSIDYTYCGHQIKLGIIDVRPVAYNKKVVLQIFIKFADEDLLTEAWGGEA